MGVIYVKREGFVKSNKILYHIDVNSAFLSWEAAYRLQMGEKLDLRTVPSAVGGDVSKRKGIILAKSIPAKKYNITTGEPVMKSLQKCPNLILVPPAYGLYVKCHEVMISLIREYSSKVSVFSIDECFVDMSEIKTAKKDPVKIAIEIKERIKKELGFTVNIGVSSNKLLAKMASDFKKPNMVHTLFPDEIEKKMWPLPVSDLFMVGRSTTKKLHKIGVFTIGDLARYDKTLLKAIFKKHGNTIWNYANGINTTPMFEVEKQTVKGIGNSTTIAYDVTERDVAIMYILSLCEMVSMRLRSKNLVCSLVCVSIKNSDFETFSHQRKISFKTNITNEIRDVAAELFDSLWDKSPIRHLGVRVSELSTRENIQLNFFTAKEDDSMYKLDKTIDNLRAKYGSSIIQRAVFLNSGVKPVTGGTREDDTIPLMKSDL
jgi:DNA polymerase-4